MRILLIVFLLFPLFLVAQKEDQGVPSNPNRLEFEDIYREDGYRLLGLGSRGVYLGTNVRNGFFGNKNRWTFSLYDTTFKLVWQKDAEMPKKRYYTARHFDGDFMYVLYSNYNKEDYYLLKLNTQTTETEVIDFFGLEKMEVQQMVVVNNICFLAGSIKRQAFVMRIDLKTKKSRMLSSSMSKESSILDMVKDSKNQLLHLHILNQKRGDNSFMVKTFDWDGNLQYDFVVKNDSEEDKNLLTGRVNMLDLDNHLVVGVYAEGAGVLAAGIYIAKYVQKKQKFIRFYPFGKLPNLFNYLQEREKKRMEEKRGKKNQKGKELDLEYRLVMHDLIKHGDQFEIVAEAYYPVYRTESAYGMYGGMRGWTPRSSTVFDGYVYTHAIVAGFDKEANLLWDNTLAIKNIKYKDLRRIFTLQSEEAGQMRLSYGVGGVVRTARIWESQILEQKEIGLPKKYPSDRLRESYQNFSTHWYGNTTLVWGFQRLRNAGDRNVKSNRNVFYLTKVRF